MLRVDVAKMGKPKKIVSDNASYFHAAVLKKFCQERNIDLVKSVAYYPQTNGLAERNVATVKTYISKYIQSNRNWLEMIPDLVISYNTSIQKSTNLSPFFIVFGRYYLLDSLADLQLPDFPPLETADESVEQFKDRMKSIWTQSLEDLKKVSSDLISSKNSNRTPVQLKIGMKVVRRLTPDKLGAGLISCLYSDGPYAITRILGPSAFEAVHLESGSLITSNMHLCKEFVLREEIPRFQLLQQLDKARKVMSKSLLSSLASTSALLFSPQVSHPVLATESQRSLASSPPISSSSFAHFSSARHDGNAPEEQSFDTSVCAFNSQNLNKERNEPPSLQFAHCNHDEFPHFISSFVRVENDHLSSSSAIALFKFGPNHQQTMASPVQVLNLGAAVQPVNKAADNFYCLLLDLSYAFLESSACSDRLKRLNDQGSLTEVENGQINMLNFLFLLTPAEADAIFNQAFIESGVSKYYMNPTVDLCYACFDKFNKSHSHFCPMSNNLDAYSQVACFFANHKRSPRAPGSSFFPFARVNQELVPIDYDYLELAHEQTKTGEALLMKILTADKIDMALLRQLEDRTSMHLFDAGGYRWAVDNFGQRIFRFLPHEQRLKLIAAYQQFKRYFHKLFLTNVLELLEQPEDTMPGHLKHCIIYLHSKNQKQYDSLDLLRDSWDNDHASAAAIQLVDPKAVHKPIPVILKSLSMYLATNPDPTLFDAFLQSLPVTSLPSNYKPIRDLINFTQRCPHSQKFDSSGYSAQFRDLFHPVLYSNGSLAGDPADSAVVSFLHVASHTTGQIALKNHANQSHPMVPSPAGSNGQFQLLFVLWTRLVGNQHLGSSKC